MTQRNVFGFPNSLPSPPPPWNPVRDFLCSCLAWGSSFLFWPASFPACPWWKRENIVLVFCCVASSLAQEALFVFFHSYWPLSSLPLSRGRAISLLQSGSLLLWPLKAATTIFFIGMFPTLTIGSSFQFVVSFSTSSAHPFSPQLSLWSQKELHVPQDSEPGHFRSLPFLIVSLILSFAGCWARRAMHSSS